MPHPSPNVAPFSVSNHIPAVLDQGFTYLLSARQCEYSDNKLRNNQWQHSRKILSNERFRDHISENNSKHAFSFVMLILLHRKCLRFLVSARVASEPCVGIFIYFAVKRCPICSQSCWIDWNTASLSHHTLCMGNLVCFHYFTGWEKNFFFNKKRVTAPILKPTYDQKPDIFCALNVIFRIQIHMGAVAFGVYCGIYGLQNIATIYRDPEKRSAVARLFFRLDRTGVSNLWHTVLTTNHFHSEFALLHASPDAV